MAVLLLDSTCEPLKVITWMKAMQLIITGDAEVMEEVEDKVIRSASQEWKMPSVIRQIRKFKRKGDVQFNRINIYMRDGWICQYCHEKKATRELTFDHVIPRDKGGQTNWENIVAACRPCNHDKANRTPEQAGLTLLRKPVKPKWLPQQMALRMKKVPKLWEPYMNVESLNYWMTELEN